MARKWLLALLGVAALVAASSGASALAADGAAALDSPRMRQSSAAYPQYPVKPRNAGVSGYVLIQFTLAEDGVPSEFVVVLSDPKGVFDQACLASARKFRYDVPSAWISANPARRHEHACVFKVIGSPDQPAMDMKNFPGIDVTVISTRKKST